MKKSIVSVLFFQLIICYCYSQQVRVVKFEELENIFKKSSDSLLLVNFWATWCGPCVEEMKYFIQLQDSLKQSKLSFIYVSLDFPKQKDKVEQFVKKKGMHGKQFILNDDPNVYINKIDKTWEGQIPYTLLITTGKAYVKHNAPFSSYKELFDFIKPNLITNK